jgi:phosphate transport system permease protein
MTDLSLRNVDFRSPAARQRLAKRYRAEARFRSYGIIGLSVTALFIALLLLDVTVKGLPAFVQHSLAFEIALDPAKLDPQGTRDRKNLARADFLQPLRDKLLSYFPDVTTRARRKALLGLLSTGAADDLRDTVLAEPSLIGRTVKVEALLSDEADLYLKGRGTVITSKPGTGTVSLTQLPEEQRFTVVSTAGDFASALRETKWQLSRRADDLQAEARRLLAEHQRLRTAGGSPDILQKQLSSLDLKIGELQARAHDLRTRASAPHAPERLDSTLPSLLVEVNSGLIKAEEIAADRITGTALLRPTSLAAAAPGTWRLVIYETPESSRQIADQEVAWLESLKSQGIVQSRFNTRFFTSGDSREPELAGIRGALTGSFLTLLVTLLVCLPVGVAAAIYLEEFASKNRLTEIIEVNINNLAAVPSIVFGLLGLALFLNTFGLPRSAALVGGLVLALLVLPTIIIASRAALKAVPPSIREAALAIGASHQQAVFHHVLPLAMPGIMTGTIIGMAHALGETAPLLMIGMVAFIVDIPSGITDSATVLPVQIYLWSDLPELAFQAKTAAAIIVLLVFLFVMNGFAIILRRRFERRW